MSWYPSLSVGATGREIMPQAGAVTLVRTAQQVGLIDALSTGLRPWRKPLASHGPGKILTDLAIAEAIDAIPVCAWTSAYGTGGGIRDGAWVAEAIHMVDLSDWPAGMRLIIGNECPHPGAQLRFTDRNGLRLTAFITNATRG